MSIHHEPLLQSGPRRASGAIACVLLLVSLVAIDHHEHEQIAAIDELDVRPLCIDHCDVPKPPAEAGPVCGNGILEAGEECDDGNVRALDGCDSTCHAEHACCCGNGSVDPGEECDDGNDIDGDGCSASCKIDSF